MQVFLETERLVLLRFTESDVDLLVGLDRDPEANEKRIGPTTLVRMLVMGYLRAS
jgi:hypothetical protein